MTEFGKVTFGRRAIDMSLFNAKDEYSEHFKIIPRKY